MFESIEIQVKNLDRATADDISRFLAMRRTPYIMIVTPPIAESPEEHSTCMHCDSKLGMTYKQGLPQLCNIDTKSMRCPENPPTFKHQIRHPLA